jgi:hypothetical protein
MWAADAATALLLATAAWVMVFGGSVRSIGPITFSLRSPTRMALLATLIVALTWLAQRSVPPWTRWRRRAEAFAQRFPAAPTVLPVVLGTRAMVLVVGLLAVKVIGFPHAFDYAQQIWPNDFINLPYRWDTAWYAGIAIEGYSWDPNPKIEQPIVFFPAFPMLMRLVATLLLVKSSTVAVVWSGVVIAWVAFAFASIYVYKLTRDQFGEEIASAAVLLLTAYPCAIYFSTAYSESLFLLVNVAAFYHFRRVELWPAALFGLVSGFCRPNGCLLSVMLTLVWLLGEWAPGITRERLKLNVRDAVRALATAATPGIGLLIYTAFIWHLTGDPLAWLNRQEAWHRDVHLGDPRLILQFKNAMHWIDAAALFLVIGSLWPIAKRLGYAAAFFVGASTLLPFLNGGLLSIGRFTSIAFPLFIWLALALPSRRQSMVVTMFAMMEGLVACAFFTARAMF